jgi:hypothetical protein
MESRRKDIRMNTAQLHCDTSAIAGVSPSMHALDAQASADLVDAGGPMDAKGVVAADDGADIARRVDPPLCCQFSLLINMNGPLAKTLELSEDGGLIKKAYTAMADGRAVSVDVPLDQMPCLIENLPPDAGLALGICRQDEVKIVTEKELPNHPGAVARTKRYFKAPKGLSLGFADADADDSPDKVCAELGEVFPPFGECARYILPSSASCVYRVGEDAPVAESKGMHIYFCVKDGRDFQRFGAAICRRLWLAGHGRIEISRAGRPLVRQTIDAATFSPERIIIEAPPVLGPGLERRPPVPRVSAGGVLDTSLCPDLSAEENERYKRLVAEKKEAAEPRAKEIREKYLLERGKEVAEKRNVPLAEGIRIVAEAQEGRPLPNEFPLHFRNFGEVSCSDVLADLEKYDKETLHDPLEPDYKSPYCAILYANNGTNPLVHSQAHGGINYCIAPAKGDGVEVGAEESPEAANPWEAVGDRDVENAIEGSLLAPMVRVLQAVTVPPLPVGIALPKALVLAGCAMSQPVEYDRATEKRRGIELARNVVETAGGQTMNAMCCIVYPSGAGKDIGNLPSRVAQENGVAIGHAGSAEGLADAYVENGAGLLTISELQPYLDTKSWQYKATGFLTSAFNQHQAKMVLSTRQGKSRDVRYCVPSVIANVQPQVLSELADPLLLDSGFLNRFLFSYSDAIESWRPNCESVNLEPLNRSFRAYSQMQARVSVPQNYLQDVLDEFHAHGAPLSGHYNRLVNEYGPRFAVMLAVNQHNPASIVLAEDHWRRAGVLVRWFYAMACKALAGIGMDRHARKMESTMSRMLIFIRRHPDGVSKSDFARQYSKGYTADYRNRCLNELVDRGEIVRHAQGNATMLRAAR